MFSVLSRARGYPWQLPSARKSKAPLFLSLGAAAAFGIGALVMLNGPGVQAASGETQSPSVKVHEEPASISQPAAALPPELAALNEQFLKLQAERVTAPFETDLAKLNTGYRSGIDKAIANEKAAGHLDGVLALEAERKLLAQQQPVPETDEAKTPKALTDLRAIYRAAHGKLETTRAANLKALTGPLAARLQQMETDLTKQDRVADAQIVRGYREALSESSQELQPVAAAKSSATPAPNPDRLKPATPLNPAAGLVLKDGLTNTLGMKFVSVPGTKVLFCVHETRYKDYAAYAAETPGMDASWKNQTLEGFVITERTEEHPVAHVSWEDAQAFCTWLSKKEGKTYRLPTDREWSYAVGIGREEKWTKDTTPAMLNGQLPDAFPWGDKWPPPKGAGNYGDASRKAKAPHERAQYLENYDDGYPTTAPVMSFKPNKLGLYDMGGNVWEWCEDWSDNAQKTRVLRGGSWAVSSRGRMDSPSRYYLEPRVRGVDYGFRCVLVVAGG